MTMPVLSLRRFGSILVAAGVVAGCGGASAEDPVATPDPAAIYSLAVDPRDGTLMVGAGDAGFYRVPSGGQPERVDASMSAQQGKSPVEDLVIRFTGPGALVGSGHAVEPTLPTNIGLALSNDQGKTWQPLSGIGKADYHELELHEGRLFGLRTDDSGSVQVSRDGGKTFEIRDVPAGSVPIDIAVNPADPSHWAISNKSGVFISTNEGRSWRQRDATFGPRLVWPAPDALYGIGLDGTVRHSADGGLTWEKKGTLGAGPREVTAAPDGTLYAITGGGRIHRSTDAVKWSVVADLL
jgi:hypothetical protein